MLFKLQDISEWNIMWCNWLHYEFFSAYLQVVWHLTTHTPVCSNSNLAQYLHILWRRQKHSGSHIDDSNCGIHIGYIMSFIHTAHSLCHFYLAARRSVFLSCNLWPFMQIFRWSIWWKPSVTAENRPAMWQTVVDVPSSTTAGMRWSARLGLSGFVSCKMRRYDCCCRAMCTAVGIFQLVLQFMWRKVCKMRCECLPWRHDPGNHRQFGWFCWA